MRRTDREITDPTVLFDILQRCTTVRIGIRGGDFPYIVPVSFGISLEDSKPVIFFHCAREGMKLDLLRNDPHVCVEGDIFIKTEMTGRGVTTRYESIIGTGVCEILRDEEACLYGLSRIMEHYGFTGYDIHSCQSLPFLHVCRIPLESLTGKRNLPVEDSNNK